MTGLGIDLGSRQVKLAAVANRQILWLREFDTIPFYKKYGSLQDGRLALDFTALELFPPDQAPPIVVTGYGRNTLALAHARVIPEIQAHVAGVRMQTGLETFTMLDLGGQDAKVARVEEGILVDFVMNDKCAASSGRYLENMAKVLDVSLEEMAGFYRDPVPLDATCGIFGESELIGRILEGHPLERLCAGVNATLLKRVAPMLRRFPLDPLVLTGGVARSPALYQLLRQATGSEPLVPEHPQHNGALGCATVASQGPQPLR
ncbi:MAG: 2-hydroxyglutaryl-CoA dehydratase [Desulfuromonadales bacterium]|nr:2-hydroxyglutaryl-CoA dehydratase [Desulfuromonadales bacterium]